MELLLMERVLLPTKTTSPPISDTVLEVNRTVTEIDRHRVYMQRKLDINSRYHAPLKT